MLAWENSGFSLDAAVRVGAQDRAGRHSEQEPLRYCARPPFALERLELLDAERVVYRLPNRPPPITPARGPPAWDDAPEPVADWDLLKQPDPDFEFDQRVAW